MKSLLIAALLLLGFTSIAHAQWSTEGETFKTRGAAEAYLRSQHPDFSLHTEIKQSQWYGVVTYTYSRPIKPILYTEKLYNTPIGDRVNAPYPSAWKQSIEEVKASIEEWYPTFRESCGETGIDQSLPWIPGHGGPLRLDPELEAKPHYVRGELQQQVMFFYIYDADYQCTNRLTSYDAHIHSGWVEYCDEGTFVNDGCGYTTQYYIQEDTSPPCTNPDCADLIGNPISVMTGAKYYATRDAVIEGVDFMRTYSTSPVDDADGLSPNWIHSFSNRLSMTHYLQDDGRWCRLELGAGSSQYKCQLDSRVSIFWKPNNVAELTVRGSHRDLYENFVLKRRTYENGNHVDVLRRVDGRIDKLVFRSGRTVAFSYSGSVVTHIDYAGMLVVFEYDDMLRLLSASRQEGGDEVYDHEDARFPRYITGVRSADGTVLTHYAYDDSGRAVESTARGESVLVSYLDDQSAVAVSDATGATSEYLFTPGSYYANLQSVSGVGQPSRSWSGSGFSASGYTQTVTGAIQRDFTFQGRSALPATETLRVDGQLRRSLAYTWDTTYYLKTSTTIKNRSGQALQTRTFGHDPQFRLTSRIDKDVQSGASRVWSATYCSDADITAARCAFPGQLTSVAGVVDGQQDSQQYIYHAADDAGCATAGTCRFRAGDLWKSQNPLGQVREILSRGGDGQVTAERQVDGSETSYAFDLDGRLVEMVRSGAGQTATTRYTHDVNGRLGTVTGADGHIQRFEYAADGRLAANVAPDGSRREYTYDADTRTQTVRLRDQAGTVRATRVQTLDSAGRLLVDADDTGRTTRYAYDVYGNPIRRTLPSGRELNTTHDPLGMPLAVGLSTDDSAALQLTYDDLDHLVGSQDPRGVSTTLTRNGLGELLSLQDPDHGTQSFEYNALGFLSKRTDARAVSISYTRDALNRVTRENASSSHDVAYTYDVSPTLCGTDQGHSIGRVASISTTASLVEFCYDWSGRVIRKQEHAAGQALQVAYTYDAVGNLASLTYPDGSRADYTYNSNGSPVSVSFTSAQGVSTPLLTEATYLPFGPLASLTFGNGRQYQRQHDAAYRVTGITDSAGDIDVVLGYDVDGQLTSMAHAGKSFQIEYDGAARVTGFKQAGGSTYIERYTYDASGNRLTARHGQGLTTSVVSPGSNRLASIDGTALVHDAAGYLSTLLDGTELTHGARGEILTAQRNGALHSFVYNGRGERIRAVSSDMTQAMIHDEHGRWLGYFPADASGDIQRIVWLDQTPLAVITAQGIHYIQTDHLDTPRLVINSTTDTPVWRWEMEGELFGATTPNEDPDLDGVRFVFDMRFPGQRHEATTGLSYNSFRDYAPALGRYVQPDPIGLSGGVNPYAYADSSPIMRSDPTGLVSFGDSCTTSQRQNIIEALNEMASDMTEKARRRKTGCDDSGCDMHLASGTLRMAGRSTYSCNYGVENGLTVRRPNHIYMSSRFADNPHDPVISSPTHPAGVGCMKSALYHEAMHLAWWDEMPYAAENQVREETRKCFDCATGNASTAR